MIIKQISLYYKDAGSDKVYHAQVVESAPEQYVVNFQYGKRGATLQTGTKTKSPVSLAEAQKAFASIAKEKFAKGYTEGESGALFQATPLEDRITGNVPALLNPVTQERLEELLKDPSFWAEEKYDGVRLMLERKNGVTTANNRKGLRILVPQSVADIVEQCGLDVLVDGELIGEKYHIFDLLEIDGVNIRTQTLEERKSRLANISELAKHAVKIYKTEEEKRSALDQLKADKKEGLVFKKVSSAYVPGRPASGGNQLKFKFLESATLEVISHHKTKSSVSVGVYDDSSTLTKMGNVTVPPNYDMPAVGSIVEVIYMHCFIGGSLYQPKYKGIRTDQDKSDCVMSQIKFKPQGGDDDEAEDNVSPSNETTLSAVKPSLQNDLGVDSAQSHEVSEAPSTTEIKVPKKRAKKV